MADKLIVLNPSRNNWGKNTSCLEASLEFFSFLGGGGKGWDWPLQLINC